MANKRISEDEIKYIISAESDRAQKAIHELTKKTKELQKEERARKTAMIELETQGKKNSKDYRNLEKECKKYSDQIKVNKKLIEEQSKKLDVNALTMVQLRKRAKELQTQLDNTSRAANPHEYASLEKELTVVRSRMNDLKTAGKNVEQSLGSVIRTNGAIATFLGNIYTRIATYAMDMLRSMKEFSAEGIRMAASADGVTRAFNKLNQPGLLEELRKATKGTVNDLELMKATTMSDFFRIPLGDLAKYLQFAQIRAQQTGQSVEYMTNSIVTGLGRQSLKILDNLGLSAAEINEEVAKTGDFMKGVANIVNRELVKAGENYISAADRAAARTVELQNKQMELGEALLPVKGKWSSLTHTIKMGLSEATIWLAKHSESIYTVIKAITLYAVGVKTVSILHKAWNAILIAGRTLYLLHAAAVANSTGNLIKYNAAMKLYNITAAQGSIVTKACTAATLLFSAAKSALTGNLVKARVAMKAFASVLKITPWGAAAAGIGLIITGFMLFSKKSSESDRAIMSLNKNLEVERTTLNNLFNEIKKTNAGTSERTRMVELLNDKYPGLISNYNLEKASLNEITRAQNEANKALTNRIATEMKAKAVSDYIGDNISSQLDTLEYIMLDARAQMGEPVFSKLQPALKSFLNDSSKDLQDFWNTFGKYFHSTLANDALSDFRDAFISLRSDQKALSVGIDDINKKYEPYIKSISSSISLTDEEIKKQVEATSAIKKLEAEKEKVQSTWQEDTQSNISLKNKELERIDEEIKKLKELGTIKAATDASKKGDSAAAKAKAEAEKKKKAILDTEKSMVSEINKSREDDLQNQQKAYNDSIYKLNLALAKKEITQAKYDIDLLAYERSVAENRLTIEQEYYNHAQSLELLNGDLKVELVRTSNQRVIDAEKAVNMARAKELMKFNNLIKDFKEQFKVTTVNEDLNAQKEVLSAGYEARKEAIENEIKEKHILEEDGRKALLVLKKAYDRASEQLELDHQQRIQSIKERYGLSTEKERLDAELAQLREAQEQGFISTEELAKAEADARLDSWKKQFDYYSNLFSGAIQSLQQAEMDNVDAKYDAEIAAAQGNAEEVERLENEKAQKKLDIEKKYADINFAIKASQIIADTAVSIMKMYTELPLPAAIVASALMGITGAAQLASANAERQKVKNMTLSGGKSSSSGATRVATGRESGGSIDVRRAQDGKLFKNAEYDPDARGFIDRPTVIVGEGPSGRSKEWVASNAAVENPTIAPILNLLDRAQQAGTIRTLDLNQAIRANMSGFASGGRISSPPIAPVVSPQSGVYNGIPSPLMEKFAQAIISIEENGIPASVALTDIDRAKQLRDRSRAIGSKS
ncbi:MAG: hypothetical protein RSO15_09635 [Bacteroides sp.]|uniref:hypothetical protein n=2 Tax=Bacteroides sp. TaxID=29523 RepID=UPI002FCC2C83